MKYAVGFIVVVSLLIGISYGSFKLYRWWNWSWGYQAMVQKEVCMMTAPESRSDYAKEICQ